MAVDKPICSHSLFIGTIIALASAVVFGMWPAAVRGMYREGANVTFALLITTWARALVMTGFCLLVRQPLFKTREDRKQSLVGGTFQVISIAALFIALMFLPGPIVIIILFSHTLMLLLYMAWRGEMKLTFITVLTTIIALLGLTFVLDLWHKQSATSVIGYCVAFVGALATVSRLYVYGHQTQSRHPIVVGAENFLVAALLLLLIVFGNYRTAPFRKKGTNILRLAA